MVTLDGDTFVTGKPITLTAGITPGVDNMFYVWTVTPVPAGGFNCRTEPVDNQLTLRCPATGRFLVSVRGQSGDTSVLGHASQQVVVGVEAGEIARAAELKAVYEAARKPGAAKLHLSLATVEPKTVVPLTWSATGNIADAAWISMVANDTPHDAIRANTSRNTTSRMIGPERSGTMRFTAPDKPGTYDLRFNDPTSERELASVSFRVEVQKRPEKPPPPPAQTTPPSRTTAAQIVATTPYGPAIPLAGEWRVSLNNWPGTLTITTDGSSVLRLPTKEEPLKDVGYKTAPGEFTFTRLLFEGSHKQVYTGIVSGNAAKGTFDCTASGKGQPWIMTRDATKTSLTPKPEKEKETSSLPNGWKQVTLGYLQFGIPASWQHKTSTESWVKTLHLYWQGNFDGLVKS